MHSAPHKRRALIPVAYLVYDLRSREQPTRSKDVLSPAGTYGRENAMTCQIVAEVFHCMFIRPMKRHAWNLVKAYQVDAAFQSMQQLDEFTGMGHAFVHAAEDDVFKGESALMAEIINLQQRNDLVYPHATLRRHELRTLLGNGRMQADGHMAVALVQETPQFAFHAHTAHGYPCWTPCPSVVGRQDLGCPQHVLPVVHRLSLPHEDDVRQAVKLRQGINLVQDVLC